jgi:hypothetical protein
VEKKELPRIKITDVPDLKPKAAGLSGKAFGITKLILGICLLPFVYSVTVSFLKELTAVGSANKNYFWAGLISFLAVYLFIYEPAIIYQRGQRILEAIFRFFAPLVKVALPLVPIYSIVIFIGYLLLSLVFKSEGFFTLFLFTFGFSWILHLVFSAKSIRSKQGDFLRANYIFGFSFIYVLNVTLLAFCLSLVFDKFSFINFFNSSFQVAKDIFYVVFRQLFL